MALIYMCIFPNDVRRVHAKRSHIRIPMYLVLRIIQCTYHFFILKTIGLSYVSLDYTLSTDKVVHEYLFKEKKPVILEKGVRE